MDLIINRVLDFIVLTTICGIATVGWLAFKELSIRSRAERDEVKRVFNTAAKLTTSSMDSIAANVVSVAQQIQAVATIADQTHKLVNSEKGLAMKAYAMAMERIAQLTKDPDDIAAAAEARRLLKAHQLQQDEVDMKIART